MRKQAPFAPERWKKLCQLHAKALGDYLAPLSGAGGFESRRADVRTGCDALRDTTQKVPDFYKTERGTWGYWTARFLDNVSLSTHFLRGFEYSVPRASLGILQLGGGPAEDLVGVCEYFMFKSQWPGSIKYLSVDDGTWQAHLHFVQMEILPNLYPRNLVSLLPMMARRVEEATSEEILNSLGHVDDCLIIVANAMVDGLDPKQIARVSIELTKLKHGSLSLLMIEPFESGIHAVLELLGISRHAELRSVKLKVPVLESEVLKLIFEGTPNKAVRTVGKRFGTLVAVT